MSPNNSAQGSGASGVLLLDKPSGMSSNTALQCVRRLLGRVKGGHTGTLDPLATGLLPICLGEATKFSGGLLEADKTYDAVVRLGTATTTGDAEGEPVFQGNVEGVEERVDEVLLKFCGEIEQMPPMFSALKHHGRPLYEYARRGEDIERRARKVSIYELTVLKRNFPDITLRVRCSKGTYVRSLAHDLGVSLGCGGHLTALRRTGVGSLRITDAASLEALEAMEQSARWSCVRGTDLLLSHLPAIVLPVMDAKAVLQGRVVGTPGAVQDSGHVRLYDEDGSFLGLGMAQGEDRKIIPKSMCSDVRIRQPALA